MSGASFGVPEAELGILPDDLDGRDVMASRPGAGRPRLGPGGTPPVATVER
jgi:hypothetical protein